MVGMEGGVVFWSVLPLVDKAGILVIEDFTIGRLVNGSSSFGIFSLRLFKEMLMMSARDYLSRSPSTSVRS